MSAVAFAGISKRFGGVEALHPIDFEIASGEFVSLLGPSGSGKTTLLNICAGYLEPSSGRLLVQGRDITREPPRRRKVGMVFQNYALFPHMTVFRNIAYGLEARGLPRTEIDRRVGAALARVRLDGFADRNVSELSGGQQQRVALARAVVIEPDILLMDEPLGALDRQLRKDVQLEIRRMHVAAPRTTLYVTHDQEEALVMSDRIAVMRAGRIVQSGTSQDLYARPADTFVARFLGESNLLAGRVERLAGGEAALRVQGLTQPVEGRAAPGLAAGGAGSALIRPEHVKPMPSGMPARIVERVFLGEIVALRLALAAGPELWSRRFGAEAPSGDHVEIGWDRDAVSILPDAT
jgi:ABC-type Fe3+/spermidine/putrescine transport system ATPase subunit